MKAARSKEYIYSILNKDVKDIKDVDFSIMIINGCYRLNIQTLFELIKEIKKEKYGFIKKLGRQNIEDVKAWFLKRSINIDELKIDDEFRTGLVLQKTKTSIPITLS